MRDVFLADAAVSTDIVIDERTNLANRFHIEFAYKPQWHRYWESKESCDAVYQALGETVINIPYADQSDYLIQCGEAIIYRPNHDVAHSLRKKANLDLIFAAVKAFGLDESRMAGAELTEEEREATRLAAYLMRAGRSNESSSKSDPTYLERSARVYENIALALGFNAELIRTIAYGIGHYAPIMNEELAAQLPCSGFKGEKPMQRAKSRLVKASLDISHHSDLVRIYRDEASIDKGIIENLGGLLQLKYVESTNEILKAYSKSSCALTGTMFYKHDGSKSKFVPPIQLKLKSIKESAKINEELAAFGEEYEAYICGQDLSSAAASLAKIMDQVHEQSEEDKAATKIQREWMRYRAHRVTKEAVEINPIQRSPRNLKRIVGELKQGLGLSAEEKAYIGDKGLLPEERALYDYLVNEFEWTLKHVTSNLPAIQANGNALKSLHQRNREEGYNVKRYTSDFEGRSDNIYFTIASPNGWPAEFLQTSHGHEIRVSLRDFLDASNKPIDKLSGLWVSSAWYGFNAMRSLESDVGGVKRRVKYSKQEDASKFLSLEDTKRYTYIDATGKKYSRTIHPGEEVATGPELLPFLALNSILELRFAGKGLRESCLAHPASQDLEAFVDLVHEQRNIEALLPAKLSLYHKGIQILPFNDSVHDTTENIDRMNVALFSKDLSQLETLLDEGVPIDIDMGQGLTPLYFLIDHSDFIEDAAKKAKYLISHGANIQLSVEGWSVLTVAVFKRQYEIVDALFNSGLIDKRCRGIKRKLHVANDSDALAVAIFQKDILMMDLFLKNHCDFSDARLQVLIALSFMTESEALRLFDKLIEGGFSCARADKSSLHDAYAAMCSCIETEKYTLLGKLLQSGLSVSARDMFTGVSIGDYAEKRQDEIALGLLTRHGYQPVEKGVENKTYGIHVFIENEKNEVLVTRRRYHSGVIANRWQSLYFEAVNDSRDQLFHTIFEATGLRIEDAVIELLIESDSDEETIRVYKARLNTDRNYKVSETEGYAKPRWVGNQECMTRERLDTLTKLYLTSASNACIKQAIQNKALLIEATKRRDVQALRQLLKQGVVDSHDEALSVACDVKAPNFKVIQLLIDYGYDVQTEYYPDEYLKRQTLICNTPLMYAVMHHNIALLNLLVQNKANINLGVGRFRITPLMLAADGDLEYLKALEENGANYLHPNNKSLFAFACMTRCSDRVFYYFLDKADCDNAFDGITPLLACCEQGNAGRIEALLKKGVSTQATHPVLRKNALGIISKSNELYALFEKYNATRYTDNKNSWFSRQKHLATYLQMSGAIQRGDIEGELAREYHISIIDEAYPLSLRSLTQQLLEKSGLKAQESITVRFALAEEGDSPVFTCPGFKIPVIAIHRDFLANPNVCQEHLIFALAHELHYIRCSTEYQLDKISSQQRVDYDNDALKLVSHPQYAIEFLKMAYEFYKEHVSCEVFKLPFDVFKGPGRLSDDPGYAGRIKAMKLTQAAQETGFVDSDAVQDNTNIRQLLEIKGFDYYPDFPYRKDHESQFLYLAEKLKDLSIEFIPFCFIHRPSQRLKQLGRLVKQNSLSEAQLAGLINMAHDLQLPGFEYFYKVLADSPVDLEWQRISRKDRCLKKLGYFRDFEAAIDEFLALAGEGKTKADIDEMRHRVDALAQEIVQRYQQLAVHKQNLSLEPPSYIPAYLVKHHGVLPDVLPFNTEIMNLMKWPEISLNAMHLALLSEDSSESLWKALWLLGVYKDDRIYEFLPKHFLDNVYSVAEESNYSLASIFFPLSEDNEYMYSYYVFDKSKRHRSAITAIDTSMLKGDFSQEYEEFIQANRIHIEDDGPVTEKYIAVIELLLHHLALMLVGSDKQHAFVCGLFSQCSISSFNEMFLRDIGKKNTLFLDFLWKNISHIPPSFFYHITREIVLQRPDKISFEQFLKGMGFDAIGMTDYERMVAAVPFIWATGYEIFVVALVEDYIQRHEPFYLTSAKTFEFLEFLNVYHQEGKLLGSIDLSRLDVTLLSLRQCVLLYRVLDRNSLFPAPKYKRTLSDAILDKLTGLGSTEHRIQMLEQMLFIKHSFSSVVLSDKLLLKALICQLAEAYAEKYGLDDGSQRYYQKIKALVDRCYEHTAGVVTINLLDALTRAIESQQCVSHHIGRWMEPDKNEDAINETMGYYSLASSLFAKLAQNDDDKREVLEFISSPLTEDTLYQFAQFIDSHPKKRDVFREMRNQPSFHQLKESCRSVYHEFWCFSLEQRAILLDSLVITAEQEISQQGFREAYNRGFEYMAEKLFTNKASDSRENFAYHLLSTYLDEADEYERQFLLAGLLVVSNESEGEAATLGRKMALLCEHMGPAYIKLAQAIHSHPDTPQDIKADLAHVKGRANPPYRWQLWRHMKAVLPADTFNKIKRLGKLLGSASYNIAIEVEHEDRADLVVTLLRENAQVDARKGFAHLRRTVLACPHPTVGSSRATLLNMIDEAEWMSHHEIDNVVSNQQYAIAHQLYDGTAIVVKQEDEDYQVILKACDNLENGQGYKLLTKMPGEEFNDLLSRNRQEQLIRKVIAKAVMAKELGILLSGRAFDSDRHGSQLRVEVDDKTIHLGLYDFGEMSLEPLSEAELHHYAALLRDLPPALKDESSIDRLFQTHIQRAVAAGAPHRHLMRVNKALLALSDFKKELTQAELKDIFEQIVPMAHPLLKENLVIGFKQSLSVWEMGYTLFSRAMSTAAASAARHLTFHQP